MSSGTAVSIIFKALKFAAYKHKDQKRKNKEKTPYINHPIEVAEMLLNIGGIDDTDIIVAALLHDTLEDTQTTAEEIETNFGARVLGLVKECTDDKTLPKEERKRLQVQNAPHKSTGAKLIKLADKTSNICDIVAAPPADWEHERKERYLNWSEQVVNGLRGVNPDLEKHYFQKLHEGRVILQEQAQ